MNIYSTAPSAYGPWTNFSTLRPAPWQPRASAALVTSASATSAFFASGMTFVNGVPMQPTFADVWQVDVGICLLSHVNGAVCGGNGVPNLDTVTCACNTGFSGAFCDSGSAPAAAAAGAFGTGPAIAVGVSLAALLVSGGAAYSVLRLGGGALIGRALQGLVGRSADSSNSFLRTAGGDSPKGLSPEKAAARLRGLSGASGGSPYGAIP